MKRVFKQDKKGFWYLVSERKPLRTFVASNATLVSYFNERYEEIFHEYDSEIHQVTLNRNLGGINLITLHGIVGGEEKKLPYGSYVVASNFDWELVIKPAKPIAMENFVVLDNTAQQLEDDVLRFFANRDKYDKLDIRHRRSCLMYGPQGNGKTTVINKVIQQHTGYVIFLEKGFDNFSDLTLLRDALQGYNIIFVIEEVTQLIGHAKENVLSLLDGEYSWTNCYTLVTTNYPEELEKNLVDRPGRFSLLLKFDVPTKGQRAKYLDQFIEPTEYILEKTDGFSIDDLRELVIRYKVNELSPQTALEQMLESKRTVKNNFRSSGRLGF